MAEEEEPGRAGKDVPVGHRVCSPLRCLLRSTTHAATMLDGRCEDVRALSPVAAAGFHARGSSSPGEVQGQEGTEGRDASLGVGRAVRGPSVAPPTMRRDESNTHVHAFHSRAAGPNNPVAVIGSLRRGLERTNEGRPAHKADVSAGGLSSPAGLPSWTRFYSTPTSQYNFQPAQRSARVLDRAGSAHWLAGAGCRKRKRPKSSLSPPLPHHHPRSLLPLPCA